MITPRFVCSQTEAAVEISIYCPSVRASDVEINVDDTLVTVHINPYFLRLNFPHSLLDDEAANAKYDAGTGYLTVTLTKEVPGQIFEDLDLLAKLLAPRASERVEPPIIEVISEEISAGDALEDQNYEDELVAQTQNMSFERQEILQAAENDWQLPQDVPEPVFNISAQKAYGFLDMHSGYFKHVAHTENEVNELGYDLETLPVDLRRQRRIEHENSKWDEEHYMADYADDETIQELIAWENPHITDTSPFEYTDAENLVIMKLPRKEYLTTPTKTHNLYLTLATLLFSYAYETRTTQGDPTPESAWTISSLTPAFSAFDPPPYIVTSIVENMFTPAELIATLSPSYRRSLAFPLYRSFALAEACRRDIADLMCKGKRTILRCLLEMKYILDHHEVYYLYSKTWVDDFCTWTQTYADDTILTRLGGVLRELKMPKESTGWPLRRLELATEQSQERQSDSDDESDSD